MSDEFYAQQISRSLDKLTWIMDDVKSALETIAEHYETECIEKREKEKRLEEMAGRALQRYAAAAETAGK